jgi:hypothetical protein
MGLVASQGQAHEREIRSDLAHLYVGEPNLALAVVLDIEADRAHLDPVCRGEFLVLGHV